MPFEKISFALLGIVVGLGISNYNMHRELNVLKAITIEDIKATCPEALPHAPQPTLEQGTHTPRAV